MRFKSSKSPNQLLSTIQHVTLLEIPILHPSSHRVSLHPILQHQGPKRLSTSFCPSISLHIHGFLKCGLSFEMAFQCHPPYKSLSLCHALLSYHSVGESILKDLGVPALCSQGLYHQEHRLSPSLRPHSPGSFSWHAGFIKKLKALKDH